MTNSADAMLNMLASVDQIEEQGGVPANAATFAGDLVVDNSGAVNPDLTELLAYGDTRVHYLCMENVTVSPRSIVPDRLEPWIDQPGTPWDDMSAPWQLERVCLLPPVPPSAPGVPAFDIEDVLRYDLASRPDHARLLQQVFHQRTLAPGTEGLSAVVAADRSE